MIYRIEMQYAHSTEWRPRHALLRGHTAGTAFEVKLEVPDGTHRQTVKRMFWREWKIDIDKLPEWQRLVIKEGDSNP